ALFASAALAQPANDPAAVNAAKQDLKAAGADLEALEEQAIRAAIAKVSPSVVQIQSVNAQERLVQGKTSVLLGSGPTTGLVVAHDNEKPLTYIGSSRFNFLGDPVSIIVTFADGTRIPAQRDAVDESRKLQLLRVDSKQFKNGLPPLPVA